jgi:hypothetical protein
VGSVNGAKGAVRWSYHLAASLGAFTITRSAPPAKRLVLTAHIVALNPYRLAQAPLVFELDMPGGPPCRWAIRSVRVDGTQLTAELDP